jgi:hypothetical protein
MPAGILGVLPPQCLSIHLTTVIHTVGSGGTDGDAVGTCRVGGVGENLGAGGGGRTEGGYRETPMIFSGLACRPLRA